MSSSIVASAAAQLTGLPPNVEACAPGGQVITSARATGDAERQTGGDALRDRDDVGVEAEVLARKHAARPAHARLHLVDDEQDAVLARELAEPLVEFHRRHDVAALALDRLDDDGGHFVGRDQVDQDLILEVVQALGRAALRPERRPDSDSSSRTARGTRRASSARTRGAARTCSTSSASEPSVRP